MVVTVRSLGLNGIAGYAVSAECFLSGGLPAFDIVGLPDAAVREARERVRAAVKNCGAKFPVSRITVNLAPAGQKKAGTVYDLPIFVGILAAARELPPPPAKAAFLGELSLTGALLHFLRNFFIVYCPVHEFIFAFVFYCRSCRYFRSFFVLRSVRVKLCRTHLIIIYRCRYCVFFYFRFFLNNRDHIVCSF